MTYNGAIGSKMTSVAAVWRLLLALSALCRLGAGVELTFELPDNAKECFHEVIEKGTEATLEFQVRNA